MRLVATTSTVPGDFRSDWNNGSDSPALSLPSSSHKIRSGVGGFAGLSPIASPDISAELTYTDPRAAGHRRELSNVNY